MRTSRGTGSVRTLYRQVTGTVENLDLISSGIGNSIAFNFKKLKSVREHRVSML